MNEQTEQMGEIIVNSQKKCSRLASMNPVTIRKVLELMLVLRKYSYGDVLGELATS
jgi:hypothetical protein